MAILSSQAVCGRFILQTLMKYRMVFMLVWYCFYFIGNVADVVAYLVNDYCGIFSQISILARVI